MQIFYLSLLVLVCTSSCGITFAIQFEDEVAAAVVESSSNLEQTKIVGVVSESEGRARGFFPSDDEPYDSSSRYSEISGIKYVDGYESFNSENRKQLNFNGNLPVRSPPTQAFLSENQFYQQQQQLHSPATFAYQPSASSSVPINSVYASAIRKRPKYTQQQQYTSLPNYQNPSDLSNPFYQNYANYYQYPSPSSQSAVPASAASQYYGYYYNTNNNPTRYATSPSSTSANLYGHPLHQRYPNYYTNNYANQYSYQRPTSSSLYANNGNVPGISNFISNVRDSTSGPLGQLSTVGSQFSKALEDISINDDLQCVPKVLCSMIRNPRNPNQLPSFLNIPGLTAIISALPSASPLMNFGRAALLGLSGGHCDSAYPKCPRDDNQVLYYLNNHRGGFFRFFNGGNSFGDVDEEAILDQQLNQQQASQGLNALALQALADTLSGSNSGSGGNGGFNLNNLFGNQRPISPAQNYHQQQLQQQQGGLQADQGLLSMIKPGVLSDVVSNLLTGVIGNRFSRQLNKRSITDGGHRIEKRIVNLRDNPVKFFSESGEDKTQPNTLFDDLNEKPLKFSNDNRLQYQQQQQSYALKFPHESGENQGSLLTPADVEKKIKMLFPDVDNFSEQFHQNLLRLIANDKRYGKILTGGQRPINTNNNNSNDNLSYYSINRYPVTQSQSQKYYAGGSSNYNNYSSNNRQPQYTTAATNSHNNNNSDRSHIVYVTNGRGQVEYAVNELTGEKTRYL